MLCMILNKFVHSCHACSMHEIKDSEKSRKYIQGLPAEDQEACRNKNILPRKPMLMETGTG